jgi:hypothetical protein
LPLLQDLLQPAPPIQVAFTFSIEGDELNESFLSQSPVRLLKIHEEDDTFFIVGKAGRPWCGSQRSIPISENDSVLSEF